MDQRWSVNPLLLVLGVVVLVGAGVLIGILVKGGENHSATESLQAGSIGDPTRGRELFVSQGCSMCHTYEGRGGADAPSLDFMQGKLSATDIADMSGTIWNHVPAMKAAFAEEGIPFPTFESNQMADLIAYLHGGGPPPDVPKGGGSVDEMPEGGEQSTKTK
jgi:mono/diheme cytochrome c family protein